jgi:hypothetical protein
VHHINKSINTNKDLQYLSLSGILMESTLSDDAQDGEALYVENF